VLAEVLVPISQPALCHVPEDRIMKLLLLQAACAYKQTTDSQYCVLVPPKVSLF
jgi:hypothetical protein